AEFPGASMVAIPGIVFPKELWL
ncbi:MAG: hypothetical protein JWO52_8096, partial [Gammaproteobacteria bacterium]|nr:hypothetical protein [Gammaproteobacteria bacterium]